MSKTTDYGRKINKNVYGLWGGLVFYIEPISYLQNHYCDEVTEDVLCVISRNSCTAFRPRCYINLNMFPPVRSINTALSSNCSLYLWFMMHKSCASPCKTLLQCHSALGAAMWLLECTGFLLPYVKKQNKTKKLSNMAVTLWKSPYPLLNVKYLT